jgi:hypothetical protein
MEHSVIFVNIFSVVFNYNKIYFVCLFVFENVFDILTKHPLLDFCLRYQSLACTLGLQPFQIKTT